MFTERFRGAWHRIGLRRLSVAPAVMLVVGLVAAAPLHAQQPAMSPPATSPAAAPTSAAAPITLDQAMQIALQQNGALRQAKNTASLGATGVKQQQLAFLPNLAATVSTSQNYSSGGIAGSAVNGLPGTGALNQSSQSVSAGVSSSVTLFNGLKNVDQLRSARLIQQAGTQDVKRAEQTVVYTVAANYINLADQQEQLRVQQQNLAAQQAQEKEIQAGVNAGTHPISDLYQQQALVASAQASVVDAQNAVALAKVTLMQTLQLDPRGTYEFATPPVDTTTAGGDSSLDLDSLLTHALSQRPDIAAQQSRAGAAKQDVSAASASWWPTVSLSAGYSTAYNSAAAASLADQLGQRQGASIGIGVSVPIFDRGATSAATQQAKIAADNANIALQTQQQQVGADVRSAYLDYQAAQQRLAAANAQLKAATQAVNAAEQRYRVGAGTLVDLTQARATLVQAQSAQVSARYDLVLQRTALTYAVGDLTPDRVALG